MGLLAEEIDAGPGAEAEVAPGVAHSFANHGDDEARLQEAHAPFLSVRGRLAPLVFLARLRRASRPAAPFRAPRSDAAVPGIG